MKMGDNMATKRSHWTRITATNWAEFNPSLYLWPDH